jgi:Protein of unknown function (DUF429)
MQTTQQGTVSKLHQRTCFVGIDISGGAKPEKTTWLTRIRVENGVVPTVEVSASLAQLPSERSALLHKTNPFLKVFEWIIQDPEAIIGIDASFSIPKVLFAKEADWETWVMAIPNSYPTADEFKNKCQTQANGKELKRQTDIETKTPFSPYNLRHYKQTYTTLREVLRPVLMAGKASVLPFQPVAIGKPWMVECCPASILKRLGWDKSPYKGTQESHQFAREALLQQALKQFFVNVPPEIQQAYITNKTGDALDSFLIAWHLTQAWQADSAQFINPATSATEALEGRVFC